MTLDEIKEFVTANSDMRIDLEKEARAIPKLHGQVINMRANELAILKALELQLDVKKRDRWIYYSGKADAKVYKEEPFDIKLLKNEVDDFVITDKSVSEIRSKIEVQKIKVSIFDEFLKSINNRNFLIRSAIDYQRLMAGLS